MQATTSQTSQTSQDTTPRKFSASDIQAMKPAGACAAIVAELRQDESESQTDYFGHRTTRRVLIGWRFTERESFAALRKAAATFPDTAHLAPGLDLYRVTAAFVKDRPGHWYAGHYNPQAMPDEFGQWQTMTAAQAAELLEKARAHLAAGPYASGEMESRAELQRESVEHRENYSMGGGNYLKAGSRHSDGWAVSSEGLGYMRGTDPRYEVYTPPAKTPAADHDGDGGIVADTGAGGYRLTRRVHTKKGTTYYQVEPAQRLPRETWERLTASAKRSGGWYSRAYMDIPGGWAFEDLDKAAEWAGREYSGPSTDPTSDGPRTEDAERFAADHLGESSEPPESRATCDRGNRWGQHKTVAGVWSGDLQPAAGDCPKCGGADTVCPSYPGDYNDCNECGHSWPPEAKKNATAERLDKAAESMEKKAADLCRNRLENTPKRQRQGMSARADAHNLEDAARAARILAAAHRAGTVPPEFAGINSAAAVDRLTAHRTESPSYYVVTLSTEYRDNTPEAQRFRAWVEAQKTGEHKAAEEARAKAAEIKRLEESVRFSQIPGFFPTPPDVIARMLSRADIRDGMTVVDPSAGKGDILDAVREKFTAAEVTLCGVEINHNLQQICAAKGYDVLRADYLESPPLSPHRVLMNPPFENLQGIDHVRRAFERLRPGGRLVAVMSASAWATNPSRGKVLEFQEWAQSLGVDAEPLPVDAFKSSFRPTGVATWLVTLDKPRE